MTASHLDIAIVGMACRLPGARTPDEFWTNLREARESIVRLSEDELRQAGVPEETFRDARYVPVHAPIPDLRAFDAALFGFSPREAAILDPQHRHFLEVAWEALETAGHDPKRFGGRIGLFAGVGHHSYFYDHLLRRQDLLDDVGFFLLRHTGNDKDFFATRVSYLLDLRGPSVNIQTACSTSLVAIHTAAQSLLSGECDMALAGAATIELPDGVGYRFAEGEILSPDGHCRPFDADSRGTVFGSGCAAVVLRRLEDAIKDGDTIHAVIKATAINNDGAQKVGYLAPSVEGHAEVAAEALAVAGIDPATVSYIEAHGTGTPVGDPIEVVALTQAYGPQERGTRRIGLGSVKSNIGHLDTAAGLASLIKVVQSLKHRELAPTLHFKRPNPACGFDGTPFRVQDRLQPWQATGLRRAGVSSLGVGGTNAHLIVEEAPAPASTAPGTVPDVLTLSARTPQALERLATRLAAHLEANPQTALHDVAWTLQVGRQRLRHRASIAARSTADAVAKLRDVATLRGALRQPGTDTARPAFLFAGGGAQFPGMGAGLYATEPAFREVIDRGLALLTQKHGLDLKPLLFPGADRDAAGRELERPSRSLPALFLVQTATAALWQQRGIAPTHVLGHSFGEYSAAYVAGILSFEDALGVVVRRGELFERVPESGMVSVAASAARVRPMLDADLSIAAENAPELCVVSGPLEALERFERQLAEHEIDTTRIRIKIAAHSKLLDPILDDWRSFLRGIRFNAPTLPLISNLTGQALTAAQATDVEYWVRQLREPVLFAQGLDELFRAGVSALIECGPGRILTTLARQHPARGPQHELIVSMRRAEEPGDDADVFADALGRAWTIGLEPDWPAVHGGRSRRRVPLPTYPFEREEHWFARRTATAPDAPTVLNKRADLTEWGLVPTWRPAGRPVRSEVPAQVLLLGGPARLRRALTERLAALGCELTVVEESDIFVQRGEGRYAFDPERPDHFRDLFRELARTQRLPRLVLHLWNCEAATAIPSVDRAALASVPAAGSVLWLAQALAREQGPEQVRIAVLTSGAASVAGEAITHPLRTMAAGVARSLNTEADGFSVVTVDVDAASPDGRAAETSIDAIIDEVLATPDAETVALRNGHRWIQDLLADPLEEAPTAALPLHRGGTYVITGGTGGIALELAGSLGRRYAARLALLLRTPLPPRSEWAATIAARPAGDRLRRQLETLQRLVGAGIELELIHADVADRRAVAQALDHVRRRFGAINGIFHTAGVLNDSLFGEKTPTTILNVLRPKLQGTLALDAATAGDTLDFFVLFSSTSVYQGLPGQTDYAAANAFLDGFAHWRSRVRPGRTLSINWSVWQEIGMAASLADAQGVSVEHEARARERLDHVLLTRVVHQSPDELELAGDLRATRDWVLDEHRLPSGEAVLPGTGYVDAIAFAARRFFGATAVEVSDVAFLAACVVPDDADRELRVSVERLADGAVEVNVRSRAARTSAGWVQHASARVAALETTAPSVALADLRATLGTAEPLDRTESPSVNIAFGPRWRNIASRAMHDRQALLELELAAPFADDLGRVALHPALLDMATAGAQQLLPGFRDAEHFFVPLSYGRFRAFGPLPMQLWSLVELRAGYDAESDTAVYDIQLMDATGQVVGIVEEFTMFRVRDRASFVVPRTPEPTGAGAASPLAAALRLGIQPAEGMEVLYRALARRHATQVIIAPAGPLQVMPPREVAEATEATADNAAEETQALELVPPRTPLQTEMVRIAAELLGAKRLGINEVLVDRGLHSLLAVRLFNRLQRLTGRNVPLSVLLEAPTIESLSLRYGDTPASAVAEQVAAADAAPDADAPRGAYEGVAIPEGDQYILPPEEKPEEFSSLVRLKPAGNRIPFFVIHARGGAVLNYQPLTRFVDAQQPVYGLQSQGLDGVTEPLRSIEAMAAHYITLVRQIQPHGPYLLGGGSLGGVIALEMAHQLKDVGEETRVLAMFDSWGPKVFRAVERPTAAGQVGNKFRRIEELLRTRGLRRTALQVYRSLERAAREQRESLAVRWHRMRQVRFRIQLPHAIRYQFVERVNLAALRVYQPRPWDGDILLFRALDDPDFNPQDPTMGWGDTVRGQVIVRDCPGTHNTIMKGPVFGAMLSEAITAAQRDAGSASSATTR